MLKQIKISSFCMDFFYTFTPSKIVFSLLSSQVCNLRGVSELRAGMPQKKTDSNFITFEKIIEYSNYLILWLFKNEYPVFD